MNSIELAHAEEIRVRGTVQGVGFRPTVYRLAQKNDLKGTVWNDGEGVCIQVIGPIAAIETFIQQLQQDCPPLARIESIDRSPLSSPLDYPEFQIAASIASTIHTQIPPDAATCPSCQTEIFDPFSRWYRYPFTNCTHCGPRLSILKAIPYDRKNTSMAGFDLCPTCQTEYQQVTNRRFHAQPIACRHCGPHAWLERADGKPIAPNTFSRLDDVDAVCTLLEQGEIVAIKGMGGIHLACDATNETVVQTLRQRKHRYHKPLALMARDLAMVDRYCEISQPEQDLLSSPAAPIVLLKRRRVVEDVPGIASAVAPQSQEIGFMLPYTPLHHLILHRMTRPIVLTSGNLSDEPQCIDNQEARDKLGKIATYFLLHDRPIVNRVDDSVVRILSTHEHGTANLQILRRARGYAPAPIQLAEGFEAAPPILAMGSELKNTFCLLQSGQAILSQHLGDLENATAFQAYCKTIEQYQQLFEHQAEVIAVDQHPDYLSTKLGREQVGDRPLESIQHHHAHVAACMAENQMPIDTDPILGIALDGLGLGADGTLWGGEFLLADYCQFERLARFKPVAMLGGTQAIRQPWRNTYAHLKAAFDWPILQQSYGDLELMQFLAQQPQSLLDQMIKKGIQSPIASSCGRLFDAVAAAVGLCREQASYEGQGAIALEALIQPEHLQSVQAGYPFTIDQVTTSSGSILQLESQPMWQALLFDLQQEVSSSLIAAKFHLGLAEAIVQIVHQLSQNHPFQQVALTGGVFQNQILQHTVRQELAVQGFSVLTHHQVPPNDGGLSLGQAAIAAARSLQNRTIVGR